MGNQYPANRKRGEAVMVMFTKEEKETIQQYAFEKGFTVGGLLRVLAFKEINGGENK